MQPKIVLEPGRADREYFKDLWRYRELFYVLAWRDVSVRYKQASMGIAWALLRPALSTVVLTVIFGKLGRFPSGGIPYPLLVLCGMLPWQLFSAGLTDSGSSLVYNSNLITKVYFPRLIIPGSSLVAGMLDFGVSGLMLAGLMAFYGVLPGWQIALLPLFLLLALVSAAGMGAWISALNVRYRDFIYLVPFIVQLGLYVSPVGFSSSVVPARWRPLYALNPMVGVIDGFRWCLLGGTFPLFGWSFLIAVAIVFAIAITGFLFFRRTERTFADVI